jgi:TolB protein
MTEEVLKELTGERGLFFSRILMSCRQKKRGRPGAQEIYVTDPDGRNLTELTTDGTLSLSPAWAPDSKRIAYTQFQWKNQGKARFKQITLMLHDLNTGARKTLSARPGDNSGAAWSPDGKQIAATLSFTKRPEIYLLDPSSPMGAPVSLSEKILYRKITGDGYDVGSPEAMFEVEPAWSPDGKKMVFSSKRTGHPNIFIVDLGSKIATQLTFAGTYNASPAWSPKGDKILFAAQRAREGHFDIYQIDPDGNNLSRVTNGDKLGVRVNSENPTWAPTGRHFAYASNEDGEFAIYAMTADGRYKHRISPSGKICTTPSWSPFEGQ